MKRIPSQSKGDFDRSRSTTQAELLGDSPVNHALIAVAQEVAELLKQVYPVQADGRKRIETIAARMIEPDVED